MVVTLNQIKRSQTYFILTLFFCTMAIRYYVFKNYYVFSNDDIYYFDWVRKISNSGDFLNADSIIMPPGYPIIMWVENVFFHTPYAIKFFEHVVLFSFFPIVILYILKLVNIEFDNFIVLTCFSVPVSLIGTSTINIATEIWYSLIVALATILLIKFQKFGSFQNLFWSTLIFSLLYLIRPESIVYSLLIILIIINTMRLNRNIKRFENFRYLSLLLVLIIPILSLSLFLTSYLGSFTISGKLKANLDYSSGLASGTGERTVLNILGLFRVIVAPMFLGPAIVLLTVFGLIYFFRNLRNSSKNFYVLIIPTLLIFVILVALYPMGRPLIATIPTFILMASLGWNFIKDKSNDFLQNGLKFGLVALLIAQVFFPFTTNRLSDSTVGYYRAIDNIQVVKGSLVFAREPTLNLFNSNFFYCSVPEECSRDPEILLLSTSSRAKLTPGIEIESNSKLRTDLRFGNSVYRFSSVTNGKYYPVFIYKKIE